ncbi:hypothetical protein E4Z66_07230 [Aliishimia ponticola]|uniref:Glycosyltransferase family 29 protein n=1 Tax=Aliishimia ponticola TaxID=2499833 RepID=A0A4S4NBG5_9RHOB|nr:glycosyltransferase family 29 protein [Aliishimia ponticola]THH36732.1 hypothetical protein E4Z66_07230 [Aliishimia ponticola]
MNWAKVIAWPRRYLWLAPRGWAIKLQSGSNARMASLIAGKRVAIVGNARSLFHKEQGSEIDGFDVIIRLNKGFVVDTASQGSRTDMVGLTPELSETEVIQKFDPDYFLMLIPKMRHYLFFGADNVARTLFYPFKWWLADRNLIGRRPSSGFMAISWLIRLEQAEEIALFGFDFGKTATYYNPEGYKTPHDFDREGEIVRGWADEGLLDIR